MKQSIWLALSAVCTGAAWLTWVVLEFLREREHRRYRAAGSFTSTQWMVAIALCIAAPLLLAAVVFLVLHLAQWAWG